MGRPGALGALRRNRVIDLHCHILPGLDDGAPDFETSLEMARMAALNGIRTIVATPDVNFEYDRPQR